MNTEVKIKVSNSEQHYTQKFLPEVPFTLQDNDPILGQMVSQAVSGLKLNENTLAESIRIVISTKTVLQS